MASNNIIDSNLEELDNNEVKKNELEEYQGESNELDKYQMKKNELEKHETKINIIFDACMQDLNALRNALLGQVYSMYSDYVLLETSRTKSIDEIKKMREELENTIRENSNAGLLSATMDGLQAQIEELEKEDLTFDVSFKHPTIDEFYKFINTSFYVESTSGSHSSEESPSSRKVEPEPTEPIDYSKKTKSLKTIGETGSGEDQFDGPMKIAYDKEESSLYIPDGQNRRVQIFTADGNFVKGFGEDKFEFPCSVAVKSSDCYVADSAGKSIYRFSLPNCEFMKKENLTSKSSPGQLSFPVDIKIDEMGQDVFVADLDHGRVCVFDSELEFKRDFGSSVGLKRPQYIQFLKEKIFVLDQGNDSCLHRFNRRKELEISFTTTSVEGGVRNGKSFCFDNTGNVIITDFETDTVKVFSLVEEAKEMKLKHRIGAEVPDTEMVGGCMGVVLMGDKLVVSCQSPDSCLKVF